MDHALGLGRRGISSKIHLVCDGVGLPLYFMLSGGQRGDAKLAKKVISYFLRRWNNWSPARRLHPQNPKYLAADKAYDTNSLHRWLKERKIKDAIALNDWRPRTVKLAPFPRKIYRRRIVIEHCFGRMKEKRGIARRSDKLAQSFEAEVWLDIILIYLKRMGRQS